MKRYLHFLLIIIWFLKPPASTLSQTQTSAGDSLYAVYLLSVIAPQPDIAHYVTAYAHLLEGTTYAAGTLDRDSVEKLQPYLQETDCTTFVETVLALARTAVKKQSTWDEYCRQLTALRYRNGKIDGYLSRLHYFSDWIANNEQKGFVTDITQISGGVPDTLQLYFMSRNADRYPALQRNATLVDGIAAQERSLNGKITYYLPTFRLDSASLATIQSGDIIAFTTDIPGLDIAHVGIAIQNNGEVRLIHASSSQGRVIVENRSILQQLKDNKKFSGIRIIRPQNFESRK